MAQRVWRSDDTDSWKNGFGDGSDGSSWSTPANAGCAGTIATKTLTLDSTSTFANGDLVIIHQSRGTNAGHYELNKIISGGGTTTLTLESDLTLTYQDSGSNQAQIYEMKQYENLTISGTINPSTWDGSKGAIIGWFDKGTTTISGTINTEGYGFRGGSVIDGGSVAYNGEGTGGASTLTRSANVTGGGAGASSAGAGGSYDGTGGVGGNNDQSTNPTSPSLGTYDSTKAFISGGGGAGHDSSPGGDTRGGHGSGIVFGFASDLVITGTVKVDGGDCPQSASNRPGGGGAGAFAIFKCVTATLGTNKVTANYGLKGIRAASWNGYPTDGTVGRLHLDYSDSYTGTTTPTLNTRNDLTIIGGGDTSSMFFMA